MTNYELIINTIKTLVALIVGVIAGFFIAVLLAQLNIMDVPNNLIVGFIVFIFVGYYLLPKAVKNGIRNW
ncbi:MAG: hypothetical protein LBR41_03355 [Rickettsiales bacterium]|jgi:uncharacterized protein YneF (UPF0154 family)|nr:hypothetical protein [Rickettsiales bacterium]